MVSEKEAGLKRPSQRRSSMAEYDIRYVGGHVEVYLGSEFLFSADTVHEAWQELAG